LAIEDRRHREALERSSPDAGRADMAGGLRKMFADHAKKELPGLAAYALTKLAQAGARSKWDWRNPNTTTYWRPEPNRGVTAKERSRDSTEASGLPDAEGRLISSDLRARDHWGTGDIRPAEEVFTAEDMAAMNRRRWRGRYY
jgi:hypothetical protein